MFGLWPGRIMLLITLTIANINTIFGQSITCPDGFTAPPINLYTGYCYRYITKTQTWNAHENECSQVTYNGQPYPGGHLATLFNANSAMVVMNNYCNNLNQGQSYYFIGYYCISSSYTSRPDWRWTSGRPTTWLHSSPTYLSGAEPDDFGCGLAHYSDDGPNTGRVGDWSCSRALSGGCCEAPVIPTPSPSSTGTQTATSTNTITSTRTNSATNTATSTRTASNTETASQTSTVTMTRTSSKTSTETRTGSSTSTATSTMTSTATSSETASSSASISVSVSESPSASESVTATTSVSVSPSITSSPSLSISPSSTKIRAMIFPADLSGNSELLMNENGVLTKEEAAALEAAETKKNIAIGAGVGALVLLCCLLGLFFFCMKRRQRKEKERRARERMNRKSHVVAASTIKKLVPKTTMANTLGVQKVSGPAMMSMFNSMNPALIKAKRGTMAPVQRNPRMTMALQAYRNTSAFKPTMVSSMGKKEELLQEQDEVQTENLVDDPAVGIQEDESAEEVQEGAAEAEAEEVYQEENEEESNHEEIEVNEEELPADDESPADDDYEDIEESLAAATVNRLKGKNVETGGHQHYKQKKTVEAAAQPLDEPRKLVIGKGAVVKEHVEKQTVMLRRVSKVRGDKELTALRQETVKFARPSMAVRGFYEPQVSNRNLLGSTPYAFTATVSRVLVKEDKE